MSGKNKVTISSAVLSAKKGTYTRVPTQKPEASKTSEVPETEAEKLSDFSFLEEPFTRQKFFETGSGGFQACNAALFFGYSGCYAARFFNDASISLNFLRLYFFSWNYFDFIARSFMHVYNITEIVKSRRDVKRQLLLESLDISATLAMGGGTTLSLLAQIHIITGTAAVICAPLASLTTSFCAIVMGFIELSKCYKAYRRTRLPILLRDRLKRYMRLKEVANEKGLKVHEQKELEKEYSALLEQSLSIARIYSNEGEKKRDELTALLKQLKITDTELSIASLTQKPNDVDRKLVDYEVNKQYAIGRNHAFNAGFWLLVGTGLALSSLATFLFPPLLIPAVVVIGAAVAVKAAETLELDKRIYNCFAKKEKKPIGNDNPIMNYLARRKKEKEIEEVYSSAYTEIKNLLTNYGKSQLTSAENRKLSKETCARMKIAFEHAKETGQYIGDSCGTAFYKQFLKLPCWTRRRYLNQAIEKKLESEALSDFAFYGSRIAKGLLQEDKERLIEQWCRKDYRFFGKPKSRYVDPTAQEAKQTVEKRRTAKGFSKT